MAFPWIWVDFVSSVWKDIGAKGSTENPGRICHYSAVILIKVKFVLMDSVFKFWLIHPLILRDPVLDQQFFFHFLVIVTCEIKQLSQLVRYQFFCLSIYWEYDCIMSCFAIDFSIRASLRWTNLPLQSNVSDFYHVPDTSYVTRFVILSLPVTESFTRRAPYLWYRFCMIPIFVAAKNAKISSWSMA